MSQPSFWTIPKVIPPKLFLDHSRFLQQQEGLEEKQSIFANEDSSNGFTGIFILREKRSENMRGRPPPCLKIT